MCAYGMDVSIVQGVNEQKTRTPVTLFCVLISQMMQHGYTPLIKATKNGHMSVIEALIHHKANINHQLKVMRG